MSDLRAEFRTEMKELHAKFKADLDFTKKELKRASEEQKAELIWAQYHDQQYNLVISGLQGVVKGEEEAAILDMCKNKQNIQNPPMLVNVHPLSKRRIIAKFLKQKERLEVLGSAKVKGIPDIYQHGPTPTAKEEAI